MRYVKTNSYSDNFTINGNGEINKDRSNSDNYTEVRDNNNNLLSTNRVNSIRTTDRSNNSLELEFANSDAENPLKNFSMQVNAGTNGSNSNEMTQSVFDSYTNDAEDTTYNRNYHTKSDNSNISATLDYNGFKRLLLRRYNLFGISLKFSQWMNYSHSSNESTVSDFNNRESHYITNESLTYQEDKNVFEYSPILELGKTIIKWNENNNRYITVTGRLINDFKSDRNSSTIADRNLNRKFSFLRYEGSFNYQLSKSRRYRYFMMANYRKNYGYPDVNQLYAIIDEMNVYTTRFGNPDLKNQVNHRFDLNANFNKENPTAVYNISSNLNAGYTKSINPVSDSIINTTSGKRLYYYINVDQRNAFNYYYSFNISRAVKKSRIQLMYNGNGNITKTPNYVDGEYSIGQNNSMTHQFNFQFSLRSLLVLNLGETFQSYMNRQTGIGLNNSESQNYITKFGVTWNTSKNISLSTTLDVINNSNLNDASNLWNAFATCRFMKQQAQLKFSAMDLLRQYQNIVSSVNSNGSSTTISNSLQQFFILTFSYFPRKFGKTEIKKKVNDVSW